MAKKRKKMVSRPKIKTSGPRRYRNFITAIKAENVIRLSSELIKEEAELFVSMIKETIEDQKINWQKLSRSYAKLKERKGLDSRIYVATGFYLDSIGVLETSYDEKEGSRLEIGVPDVEHPSTGINLRFLAQILEYGSAKMKIPPRPLWRPVLSKFNERQKKLKKEFRQRLMRKSGFGKTGP